MSMTLLRAALALCPPEFRVRYTESIDDDVRNGPENRSTREYLATCADVASSGLRMHAEDLVRNLAFAIRSLAHARLFASISILTIALAMGANVAVVSVLKAVILEPLPYSDASRLVFVTEGTKWIRDLSYPDAVAIQRGNSVFSNFAESIPQTVTFAQGAAVLSVRANAVSGSYFNALGIHAELGRLIDASDLNTQRVVLADDFWRTYFHASRDAIGKHIVLDGADCEIIGVAPAGFKSPSKGGPVAFSLWRSIDTHADYASAGSTNFYGIGVLRPGAGVAQAESDMNRILWRLARLYPQTHTGFHGARVVPMLQLMIAPIATLLWLLYAAVWLVLLIACVNIANLSLVRAIARSREFLLRAALGASRYRLVAGLCTETFVLSLAGASIGIGLGILGLKVFSAIGSSTLPRWEDVHVDWAVLAYVGVIVVAFTLFSGLIPLLTQRDTFAGGVRSGGRTQTNTGIARVHATLIVAEIALAIAIVCSAGLVWRSFVALTHVDIGFNSRNLYLTYFDLPDAKCRKLQPCAHLIGRLEDAIRGVPGVQSASVSLAAPFGHYASQTYLTPAHAETPKINVTYDIVSPDFFRTLGVPLLRGRAFTADDRAGARPVAIVNAALARRLYGSLDAVGKHVVPEASFSGPYPVLTIVGVAADARTSYGAPAEPEVYAPYMQLPDDDQFVVRTDANMPNLGTAVSAAFERAAPMLARPKTVSYRGLLAQDASQSQASTMLFGALALIALVLSMCGVFAVSLYAVEQRTREFGIRSALGARTTTLLAAVLQRAVAQAAAGIVLGIIGAVVCARFLQSQLFDTSPFDPVTFCGVTLLIVACTLLAASIPAIRAARTNAVVALRCE